MDLDRYIQAMDPRGLPTKWVVCEGAVKECTYYEKEIR
jgi:hypothetical protein